MLGQAHKECQKETMFFLKQKNIVIVDNTSLTKYQIQPYLQMVPHHKICFISIVPNNQTEAISCAVRNLHFVPIETVLNKLESYESLVDDYDLKNITKFQFSPHIPESTAPVDPLPK